MANGHGGKRPNSGRKSISEEMKTRQIAQDAIKAKHGSIKDGMIALLETGEPTLVKFVWEHAQGKPTDKIDLTSRVEETRIVDINDDGTEDEDGEDYDDTDDLTSETEEVTE